ncbi:MAG: hypothetical protein PVJ80_17720, partial [Gemmatimonadota bacterium]
MTGRAGLTIVGAVLLALDGAAPSEDTRRDTEVTRRQSCCPYYPYDGAWTFVRIQTASFYGGGSRFRGGWSHDYPSADT